MIKFNSKHLDDDFQPSNQCNAWVATAVIGSAVIGAGAQIYGSNKASNAQQQATAAAAEIQKQQYAQTRSDLSPYRDIGTLGTAMLTSRIPELTDPINLTQDWLESTPGYQFTKAQGLKATQNSAAARGLGVSGAALKGAATFATGLADNTYKTQFDVANTNKTNAYNRLKGLVDVGENAAAQTGVLGEKSAYNQGAATIAGGNAAAAGANATGNAVAGFANNVGGYAAYRGLYGGGQAAPYSGVFGSGAGSGGNNGAPVWGMV